MPRKIKINNLNTEIPAKIKTQEIIDPKRKSIIKGALSVFKEKGYHKATVRDIAKAAKISVGSLYDYISSKEDLLYLFYEIFILTYYQEVVAITYNIKDPVEKIKSAYRTLLEVGFSLEDEILFGWTEAKNMKKSHLKEILKLEIELINFFKEILEGVKSKYQIKIEDTRLVAHFLVYSGMFGILRRWGLRAFYTREQVIDFLMETQLKPLLPSNES
ncbi:MAG: TetR/AcrR family transcriptional regulator [Desulfobacterota bacterium]|nr:TetR/AcrR family transcriptional regulator [Thermodesulfobacteriota bacterium]